MTMDCMVDYLKNRGFDATKKFDKNLQAYRFHITKDGFTLQQIFKYPAIADQRHKDQIQREFLDGMIKKFYSDINHYGIEDLYPSTMMVKDIIERQIKEGEKMYNRRIKWKVHGIETWGRSYDGTVEIKATIGGAMDPLFCGTIDHVRSDLQKHLDNYNMSMEDQYIHNDINVTRELMTNMKYAIKNVIFNDPATIVFWADGSKTVVKCQGGDLYDPEKGLAMAIVKKTFGNKGNYCNEIKKWLPEEKPLKIAISCRVDNGFARLAHAARAEARRSRRQMAYHGLLNVINNKKATKKDMLAAMEEAVGYLGESLED